MQRTLTPKKIPRLHQALSAGGADLGRVEAMVPLTAVESRADDRKALFDDTKRVLTDLPDQSGLLETAPRI